MLGAIGVEGTQASQPGPSASNGSGAALASYLLFESEFTRELIALGIADTMAKKEAVLRFLGTQAIA